MLILSRRSRLAIAAVVDIALHARPAPVAAKALAARHGWPARHLEPALQALVRRGILKGVRGPRGGYQLGRERRRITAAEILRASLSDEGGEPGPPRLSPLDPVVDPVLEAASAAALEALDRVTLEELCREAERRGVFRETSPPPDFTI